MLEIKAINIDMIMKILTLQEANNLLPLVKEHFLNIGFLLGKLHTIKIKHHNKNLLWKLSQKSSFIKIIKNQNIKKYKKETKIEIDKIEKLIENEINNISKSGAIIKSLFPPHIDFLSAKNGQLIYLCWHSNENEITHWHYFDDNYAERQLIKKDKEFGPMMVN